MPVLKPVKKHFFVKWLHAGFYAAVAELECYSCENFWSREDIARMMTCQPWDRSNKGPVHHGKVITDLKMPVGYTIYLPSRRRKSIALLNLVMHPDYRRQGLGAILLNQIQMKIGEEYHRIVADVRESNTAAHLFLRHAGFKATGVIKEFFLDEYPNHTEKEDAYHFEFLGNDVKM